MEYAELVADRNHTPARVLVVTSSEPFASVERLLAENGGV
jgi:hypothetical protein